MSTTHLLYLHGFRSSPRSAKAQQLAAWMAIHRPGVRWWCPQLPPSPREAMTLIGAGTTDWPADTSAVVGSSLGGFYATALAETPARRHWRVAVINLAIDPARGLPIIATGNERLDWREMAARYAGEPMLRVDGSDHTLSDFAAHLPRLLEHLSLAPA